MKFLPINKLVKSLLLLLSVSQAQAAIIFNLNFTPDALAQYSVAEQQAFTDGLVFWDSIIDGHQDGVDRTFTLTVDAFDQAPAGGFITLGSAGPGGRVFTNVVAGAAPANSRYIVATTGFAQFNTNAAAGALRADVILHEIGHTLGIGTLWEDNELYNDGVANNSNRTGAGAVGQYTGANGVTAYQAEFNQVGNFIPVELGGGGTAHGHWNEVDGGNGLTGITNADGQDFRDELMTGFAAPSEGDSFVSETTKKSLIDLGFTLHPEPVPEPSSTALLGLGGLALALRRKR